ncbi:MAG: hypothetical protein AAGB26_17040 [Planctomycetota bacterium]
MNLNQPDETIDDALLDEALSEATPAELESKILALTDPAMLSLLDEAMAPETTPLADDHLTQRILAATQASMKPGTVPITEPANGMGVLARIGPTAFRYAAAAAIALAVGWGVWFISQTPGSTTPPMADNTNTPDVVAPDQANDGTAEPDWLGDDYLASADDTVDLFGSDLGQAEDDFDMLDSLDDITVTRDTIWDELDAYEQFLSDIES